MIPNTLDALFWICFQLLRGQELTKKLSGKKNPPANAADTETWIRSLGREDPLEKEMATHSNILAWEIPWTEEPGRLWSMELQKSRTRLSD